MFFQQVAYPQETTSCSQSHAHFHSSLYKHVEGSLGNAYAIASSSFQVYFNCPSMSRRFEGRVKRVSKRNQKLQLAKELITRLEAEASIDLSQNIAKLKDQLSHSNSWGAEGNVTIQVSDDPSTRALQLELGCALVRGNSSTAQKLEGKTILQGILLATKSAHHD